jgi:hypothetical protein
VFINIDFLLWATLTIYLFYLLITLISIFIDEILYKNYDSSKELMVLVLMAVIEPIVYHPICVYASLKGYWHFFNQKEQSWGVMTRKGFASSKKI